MDVLANYTTYQTFWKIEKATEEDPEYDAKKARRAIARFVSLHPHHLAQKAEIIVEHFRQHTAKEMGGLAKAMVVTSSRLHAVRYKQNIDKYIKAKGYARHQDPGRLLRQDRRRHRQAADRGQHERLPRIAGPPRSSRAPTTAC